MSPSKSDFPLLDYIDSLVDELRDRLPEATASFEPGSIHKSRVTTRRLKAAIDLLEPVLSKEHRKPFAKVLKKIRKMLGPLRDLDVAVDNLSHLPLRGGCVDAQQWLIHRLQLQREQLHAKTGRRSSTRTLAKLGTWWGLREEVIEAREAVDSLLAEAIHSQADDFARDAAHLVNAPGQSMPQDPHALRIAGKALRYTLELAVGQGHPLPSAVMKNFKKMQSLLGSWHDFVVLGELSMRVPVEERLAEHDSAAQLRLIDLTRLCLRRAERYLERFKMLWTERGEEVVSTIRTTFPIIVAAEEATSVGEAMSLRMDPDRSDSAPPPPPPATDRDEPSIA